MKIGPDLTHNGGSPEGRDALVGKVTADVTALEYCGYIGGTLDDAASDVAVGDTGSAYVVGHTRSSQSEGFPVRVGPDLTFNGDSDNDAFMSKIEANGSDFCFSGYVGGTGADYAHDVALDGAGNLYLAGETSSSESEGFPGPVAPGLTPNGLRCKRAVCIAHTP